MEIKKLASAGTVESSDILVTVKPATGINITLDSTVEIQFGEQIKAAIEKALKLLKVDNIAVHAIDKGAIDCVIIARVETAVLRAAEVSEINFGEL